MLDTLAFSEEQFGDGATSLSANLTVFRSLYLPFTNCLLVTYKFFFDTGNHKRWEWPVLRIDDRAGAASFIVKRYLEAVLLPSIVGA